MSASKTELYAIEGTEDVTVLAKHLGLTSVTAG